MRECFGNTHTAVLRSRYVERLRLVLLVEDRQAASRIEICHSGLYGLSDVDCCQETVGNSLVRLTYDSLK